MADIGAVFPLITLVIGYLLKLAQDWLSAHRARRQGERELWYQNRQQYYLPLLGAAEYLSVRFTWLNEVYSGRSSRDSPDSISADFRELYLLSRDPITSLYDADPNQPRRDERAVQALRTRMCRDLNAATTCLYQTARYIALAELTRNHVAGGRHGLPGPAAVDLNQRIADVASALEGPTGAGLPPEQHESIGEMMCTDSERVIPQYEFRKRLLELPGWEQFTSLLTFFITEDDNVAGRPDAARLQAKIDHEVRETARALNDLCANLRNLTAVAHPQHYRGAPRNQTDPWPVSRAAT